MMIVRLEGLRQGTDRIKALKRLREIELRFPVNTAAYTWHPTPIGPRDAQGMLANLPIEFEMSPMDLDRMSEVFILSIVDDGMQEGFDYPVITPFRPTTIIMWPEGRIEVNGNARDIADAIYRLLDEGIDADRIMVGTEPDGGGPVGVAYGVPF